MGVEDAGVRPARAEDLPALPGIEAAGDAQLQQWFGQPTGWDPPSSGEWRARQPGFLLVAVEETVVGFAHALEVGGWCHLEQLCVAPDRQRRGHGRELVRSVAARARDAGYDELSLCTFVEVPWNAPFYERLGFAVRTPTDPFHVEVRAKEHSLGLERLGERALMVGGIRQILAA